MANSSLVKHIDLSPNNSGARTQKITKITPHHMAGNLSVETCGRVFKPASRQASSNYGIDSKGNVGMYVEESKRSWASSSAWNDQRSVTIEVADEVLSPEWRPSDKAYSKLVELCADICKRNPGIVRADGKTPGLNWTGDRNGSLTAHYMFAATGCPGAWLKANMKKLEQDVNAMLDGGKAPEKPAEAPAPAKPTAPAPAPAPKPVVNPPAEIKYRVRSGGRWLPEMIGLKDTGGSSDTYAGNVGKALEYISIQMPKGSWYQVRTKNGWLPKVYSYNPSDLRNGAAGDGSPILAIRCWYNTANPGTTGYYKIEYQAHVLGGRWLPAMRDLTDTGGSRDDFAGNGKTIDCFRAKLVKA